MKEMIYESELKVLKILWKEGDVSAKELAIKLNKSTGWSKTTTYTVLKRCVEKGLILRLGYYFTCRATITEEEARKMEIEILTNKMFDGSSDLLVASLLGASKITATQIDALRNVAQEFLVEG